MEKDASIDESNGKSLDEVIEKAKDLRLQGNHLFRQQNEFQAALSFYTQALETLPTQNRTKQCEEEAILNYCNRSACHFVMEEYREAKEDAQNGWILSDRKSSKVGAVHVIPMLFCYR